MTTKHIAVFGASGGIGSATTKALIQDGHTVTALQHAKPVPEGCTVVEGSVSDFETVQQVVGENEIVLQLATTKGDRATFMDVAVRGTYHILDAIWQRGGCEQFVLAGGDCSVGIWFYRQPKPITEDAPLWAYPGYYALSKVLEEVLADQYHKMYGIPITILRMGFVHSPATLLKFLVAGNVKGQLFKNMFRSVMPPELKARAEGEGEGFAMVAVDQQGGTPIRRTTVSFDDVVQAWRLAIGDPRAINEIFNVVHPAWDYAVVGDYLAGKLGITAERVPLDAHSFDVDTTKARTVLGWQPNDDVFSMLDRAIADLTGTAGAPG